MADYLPIATLFVLSTLFAVASIFVASKVGPQRPSPAKDAPYESGIVPLRAASEHRFPVKFYLVAMLFIIFDIELVFFYPWAVIFRELRIFGLVEMGIFVALLLVAYFYVIRSGALDWSEKERRATRAVRAMVSEPRALASPGEGGSNLDQLIGARPEPDAPLPPDKVVV